MLAQELVDEIVSLTPADQESRARQFPWIFSQA